MKKIIGILLTIALSSCHKNPLRPSIITESTAHDTDDPALWVHPTDPSKSLIVGTDKESGGGIYLFDLEGKIVKKVTGLLRPNNVDVAYGLQMGEDRQDVAVFTEREANTIRVFSLPELRPLDGGGIPVFEGEIERSPMGIALFQNGNQLQAIVGRKSGPREDYLWQYALEVDSSGKVSGDLLRKFGKYSGKKEIEAITIDQELGYVYYSDETAGVRKYHADPKKGKEELAFFAQTDAKRDHEGLALFKTGPGKGYLILSNQQNNSILLYPREGSEDDPHLHLKIKDIPVSAKETDGLEVSELPLNSKFPEGILVLMSNGKVFHLYDWREVKKRLEK
jgi:3-phytase